MFSTQELLVILFIILLFQGRKKLPELARALGRAKKEYLKEANQSEILKIAKNLGIETEGKSEEDILREIEDKTKVKFSSEP